MTEPEPQPSVHRRRVRYRGKNPRRFAEKYKEHNPEKYGDTIAQVLASGKTPAGAHRPIMVAEVLTVLVPKPGDVAIDATLGYGGHAAKLLERLQPGGRLLGLDIDPIELPKTEARLRTLGFGPETFTAHQSSFAGVPKILATASLSGADIVLADLGVSSMQLDDPTRGFSMKLQGPLDLRMNPSRGQAASALLQKMAAESLARFLEQNADEPKASILAHALAGRKFESTTALAAAVREEFRGCKEEERELAVRRVFQALRIAVNDEFSALESFLRQLPACMKPHGRIAIVTFHSGEDRRVKKSFADGRRSGFYDDISEAVIRPTATERHSNPRSASAKLRWARRSAL